MISSNTNALEFIYDIHIMLAWDIRKFAVTNISRTPIRVPNYIIIKTLILNYFRVHFEQY